MEEEAEVNVTNACRLCLKEDNEMISLNSELYENIQTCSGITMANNPAMPCRICGNCSAILKFIQKFRKMCLNSDIYLRDYCGKQAAITIKSENNENPIQIESQINIEERELNKNHQIQEIKKSVDTPTITLQQHEEEEAEEEIVQEDQQQLEIEESTEYLYEIEENLNENEDDPETINDIETDYENENDEAAEEELWIEESCEHDDISDETIYIVDDSNSVEEQNGKTIKVERINKSKLLRTSRAGKTVINYKSKKEITGERHVCEICGKRYKKLGSLEAHRQRHQNQCPLECEICSATFSFNFQLERHMRKHTGDRPYTCEYCNRKFVDRSTMGRHQKIHRNERPYKCETCGRSFTYYSVLKTHIMSHTGEKPFCCGICEKSFHRASDLRNHLETLQHRNDPRTPALLKDIRRKDEW